MATGIAEFDSQYGESAVYTERGARRCFVKHANRRLKPNISLRYFSFSAKRPKP